ncbi:MAG TPA: T9SS type A sorting domain-containing protein [Chitinophagales bacterium]|nr:T9SS type A sorting domain-containing protein [Chitinophagales bacterium]
MHTKSLIFTRLCAFIVSVTILFISFSQSKAYTVSNLATECHNGQIFLTWTNPSATNLQYNVYRSVVPFTLSSQINSTNYLGFVRDNSSQNIFWSQQTDENIYYKITDNGQPLPASKGLYVVTCTGTLPYYYEVSVTALSNGNENKTIVPGENTTLLPQFDLVAQPQPVFQDSFVAVNGEVKQLYVQYANNQETSRYPAMSSVGSYGFNFWLVKRGTATEYPLFILFQGAGPHDADKSPNLDNVYTNCYIMGVYDWLPIPQEDGSTGDNTYFCCYHQKFNFYSNTNPIPTTGVVKTYFQKLYWQGINWLKSEVAIDTTRLYLKGTSETGFGALITASLNPEKIAAVYSVVEPNATAAANDLYKQMWGSGSSKLKIDVVAWNSADTLLFNDVKNQQIMLNKNTLRSMPAIYDVHGKNDITVVWNSGKTDWLDSLDNNHIGGAWYWDQRNHGGNGSDFASPETEPNFYRFATNISYPAFSNCSVNQNPGNGTPSNGDPYGAINGYLDWHDDNIVDKACTYAVHVFMKDFYVGGVLDPEQYSTCKTDITIRRMQRFLPAAGATIQWSNYDEVTNAKIQNGNFTYGGGLISIPGLIINKSGNKIKFTIKNCSQRIDDAPEGNDDQQGDVPLYFSKSPDGYTAHIDVLHPDGSGENVEVLVYDLMGRMVWEKKVSLASGTNTFEIPSPATGIFLVQVKGETFSHAEKLFF